LALAGQHHLILLERTALTLFFHLSPQRVVAAVERIKSTVLLAALVAVVVALQTPVVVREQQVKATLVVLVWLVLRATGQQAVVVALVK
jgi:hypothetical protein